MTLQNKSINDYAQAIYDLVSSNPDQCGQYLASLNKVLNRERKSSLLPLIIAQIEFLATQTAGKKIIEIETVTPINESLQSMIINQLSKKIDGPEVIELHEIVRPSLIGGLKIKIGDQVVDDSIQTKLANLRARF